MSSIGDRVVDRISDASGTVKDHFMNQTIVRWDEPDEEGNYVSSVPTADLTPQKEERSEPRREATGSDRHHIEPSGENNA